MIESFDIEDRPRNKKQGVRIRVENLCVNVNLPEFMKFTSSLKRGFRLEGEKRKGTTSYGTIYVLRFNVGP